MNLVYELRPEHTFRIALKESAPGGILRRTLIHAVLLAVTVYYSFHPVKLISLLGLIMTGLLLFSMIRPWLFAWKQRRALPAETITMEKTRTGLKISGPSGSAELRSTELISCTTEGGWFLLASEHGNFHIPADGVRSGDAEKFLQSLF